MANTSCKTCRRIGQKLFLKEERCFGPKCTLIRKPYAPGGNKRKKRRTVSEYGAQLKEKQSLKNLYGLRERQFANLVRKSAGRGDAGISARLLQLLESRLDNAVFKLGLAKSRHAAKQLISHGHICVNGRKINTPSYQTKKNDKISIRAQSANKKIFAETDAWLKKYNPPPWLKLDKKLKEGVVTKEPDLGSAELGINLNSIIEYYSR